MGRLSICGERENRVRTLGYYYVHLAYRRISNRMHTLIKPAGFAGTHNAGSYTFRCIDLAYMGNENALIILVLCSTLPTC